MIDRRRFITALLGGAASLGGLGSLATLAGCHGREQAGQGAEREGARLVSIGGALTELAYALGIGEQLVGADTSSYFPSAAAALPKVGYQRKIAAEGVIGLGPSLVLHTESAGPATALEQIAAAGIELASFPEPRTLEQARARIQAFAARVGRVDEGEALLARLDAELAEVARLRGGATSTPSVLFVYARGADVLMVGGRETPAATMIEAAGGRLAFDHAEYQPLSAEAVIAAAPEVLLVTERGLGSVGGSSGLLTQPGLAETPAGRAKRVVALDDLGLLGFGPRTGATLQALTRALHPELA